MPGCVKFIDEFIKIELFLAMGLTVSRALLA